MKLSLLFGRCKLTQSGSRGFPCSSCPFQLVLIFLAALCLILGARYSNAATATDTRTTVAVVLSWYTILGASNGRVGWKNDGFAYKSITENKARHWKSLLHNAPLASRQFEVRPTPSRLSNAYWNLVREAAREELGLLKEAGFDVFAFDMLPNPNFDPNIVMGPNNEPFALFSEFKIWLDVAGEYGMKGIVFADIWARSGDFPTRVVLNDRQWIDTISASIEVVGQSANYWRRGSRPVLMHFGTDRRMGAAPISSSSATHGGWADILGSLKKRGLDIFFVADVRRPDIEKDEWVPWASALYMFIPSAPTSYIVDFQTESAKEFGSDWFWVVSPGYYRPGVAYVKPDFSRLHSSYAAAAKSSSEVLVFLTWNDFEEETDIVPSLRKGPGLNNIVKCYNSYFKTRGWACDELLVIAYPPAIGVDQQTPSPRNWGGRLAWSEKPFADEYYFWAFSDVAGRVLNCESGNVTLRAGVNFGVLPGAPGAARRCSFGSIVTTIPTVRAQKDERSVSEGLGLRYFVRSSIDEPR